MKYIELNIGLAVEGRRDNDPQQVAALLEQMFALRGWRLDHSDTEATVVARIEPDGTELDYGFAGRIYRLANFFGQDCIAVFYGNRNHGELIGPNAKSWGRFNPDFFIRYEREEAA